MWSDNETTIDFLGFRVHADFLKSLVTSSELLPVTIGLFGDWGSGKTSVMKMLEQDLLEEDIKSSEKVKEKNIVCIYFNGWMFEGYDDAKSAIISSILIQLGEHKRIGPKIRDTVVSLLKSVNWMRIISLGLKNVALPVLLSYLSKGDSMLPVLISTMGLNPIIDTSNGTDKNKQSELIKEGVDWENLIKSDKSIPGPLDIKSFRNKFAEMLKKSDIDSLVVLIDDLDRCSPERIVDNLEAIKLFLSVEKTAFIIGADPRIVSNAIEIKYKISKDTKGEEFDKLVKDYLEKLIQIPYSLPRLSPSEIESYMILLFSYNELEKNDFDIVYKAFQDQKKNEIRSVFGCSSVLEALNKKDIPESLQKDFRFCSNVAPLITEGLKGNPRQVKRFLNAFILRRKLAIIANLDDVKDDVLVKLMVLEYVKLDHFNDLFNWQVKGNGFPKEIVKLEKIVSEKNNDDEILNKIKDIIPGWSNTFILKWLRMEPKLSDIDLRDYFWITRDKLKSTFSEVSFISKFVRTILDELLSDIDFKRKSAITSISKLDPDEINELLNIIGKHVLRYPDQTNGFNALFCLIDHNVTGSMEKMDSVLKEIQSSNIQPGLAPTLIMLLDKHKIKDLDSILDKIAKENTKFGKALEAIWHKG